MYNRLKLEQIISEIFDKHYILRIKVKTLVEIFAPFADDRKAAKNYYTKVHYLIVFLVENWLHSRQSAKILS